MIRWRLSKNKGFYMKGSRSLRVSAVVLACCLVYHSAFAGFLDDFLANKTSGSANYLSGQQRGMMFGGSFSAHWPVSENNNLISSSLPKLSGGCGGIDAYGGNLAFLKPEMLVKKLQNVLQNSAGVAFQMALDTICSKCNTIMNMAENLSNNLNKMSMDDCNAAKGLVTSVRSSAEDIVAGAQMGDIAGAVDYAFTDSYATLKQSIPAVNTLSDMNNWFNSQTGKPATTIPSTSGCTDPLMAAMFPSDTTAYPISALQAIGGQIGMPQTYQDMLRAMIGDIRIMWIGGIQIMVVDACANNLTPDINFLSAGSFETKNFNGDCALTTDTNGNLIQYMNTAMTNILSAMKSQSQLQAADTSFLQSMPLPVLYGMRMAILGGTDSSMVPMLAQLAANEWMAAMMSDVITRYGQIFSALHDIQGNSTDNMGSGAAGTMCKLTVTSAATKDSIKTLAHNAETLQHQINDGLAKAIQDFKVAQDVGQRLDELNKSLDTNLKKSFGPSVAYRMMQKLKNQGA